MSLLPPAVERLLIPAWLFVLGCGAGGARPPETAPFGGAVHVEKDHPPVAALIREGDPRGALAIAISTEGISPEEAGRVPSAIAAVIEARLPFRTIPSGIGVRAARPIEDPSPAAILLLVEKVRLALGRPLDGQEMAAVERKWAALDRLRLPDPALTDAAECRGSLFAPEPIATRSKPTAEVVEGWRRTAVGLGRIAFGVVGPEAVTASVTRAVHGSPAWTETDRPRPDVPAAPREPTVFGRTSPEPGESLTIALHLADAPRVVDAARRLVGPDEPLTARLAALESDAHLRDVTAVAHAHEGCLALELAFRSGSPSEIAGDTATIAAVVRQEVTAALAASSASAGFGLQLARAADDPLEAAGLAAAWTLVEPSGQPDAPPSASLALGIDADSASPRSESTSAPSVSSAALASEVARADAELRTSSVESRVRVERGQAHVWVLVASPCGALSEDEGDAGGAALIAAAAVHAARARNLGEAEIAPFVSPSAIGVVAHGPARAGEAAVTHARRIADLAARSLLADPVTPLDLTPARASLLANAEAPESALAVAFAKAVAPNHPAWFLPTGTPESIGRSSDPRAIARANALRQGPWRGAVLANVDAEQGRAASQAIDRWVTRHGGAVRACPPIAAARPLRPGTYPAPRAGAGEAWLALPLALESPHASRAAELLARALDAKGGPLSRALGDTGLAKSFQAAVVGPPARPLLALHLASAAGALDAAVAETRALLDRLHKSGFEEADVARAFAADREARIEHSSHAAFRLAELWRAAPEDDPVDAASLQALAAATLVDERLVIVATPPPHAPSGQSQAPALSAGAP